MYEFRIKDIDANDAVVVDGIVRSVRQANLILRAMYAAWPDENLLLDYKKLDSGATDEVEIILAESRNEYGYDEHAALDE